MIIYFNEAKPHVILHPSLKNGVIENIQDRGGGDYCIVGDNHCTGTIDFGGCALANAKPIELIDGISVWAWHYCFLMDKLRRPPRITAGVYKIHAGNYAYCMTQKQYNSLKKYCFENQRVLLKLETEAIEELTETFASIK